MSDTFKVGIVGAGIIGEVHARELEGVDNATVIAVAERAVDIITGATAEPGTRSVAAGPR